MDDDKLSQTLDVPGSNSILVMLNKPFIIFLQTFVGSLSVYLSYNVGYTLSWPSSVIEVAKKCAECLAARELFVVAL